MSPTPITEEILRRPPFRRMLTIDQVTPLSGTGALSGKSFRVNQGTRRFKLHRAESRLAAMRIQRRIKRFAGLLPRFHGRDGPYLLFDWVEGHYPALPCDSDTAFRVGQFCGEVHAAGIGYRMNPDRYFAKRLRRISGDLFSCTDKARILTTYTHLRAGLDLPCVLGISDLHIYNFIDDGRGRLYLVDEGALSPEIKGRAFIKAFSDWIAPDTRNAFWDGYASRHDRSYFTSGYETLLSLIESIRAIECRARRGMERSELQGEIKLVAQLSGLDA
jgi:hypothetical protein